MTTLSNIVLVKKRPRDRLGETLVDRQIDTALAVDRHQVARRLTQHLPNCVSGIRASPLKHALEPLRAFLRFSDGTSHTLLVYAGRKSLGTSAASPNNFGKSPLWAAHARLSAAK